MSSRRPPQRRILVPPITAAVTMLLTGGVARAQIVNVQPLVAGKADAQGFTGAVEATVDWRTGNNDLLLLAGNAIARYRHERHVTFGLIRGELGVNADERFLAREFEHVRYTWERLSHLHPEAFVQHDRDEFRRRALRALVGVGPRLPVVASDTLSLAVGTAYMLEFERLADGPEADAGEETLAHRNSSYVVGRFRPSDSFQLGPTVYLQPRLDDPGDFRLLGDLEALMSATSHIGFKMTFSVAHDTRPPIGLDKTDTTLKGALQLSI